MLKGEPSNNGEMLQGIQSNSQICYREDHHKVNKIQHRTIKWSQKFYKDNKQQKCYKEDNTGEMPPGGQSHINDARWTMK